MNRRIVLDDADIVPAPKPPKLRKIVAVLKQETKPSELRVTPETKPKPQFEEWPFSKSLLLPHVPDQVQTFDEFFSQAGLGISPYTVFCGGAGTKAGCHQAGDFDANNDKRTITCMTCGRTVTWAKFAKEQQGK
jgi:hypothetical protein